MKTTNRPRSKNVLDYRRTAFENILGSPFKKDPRSDEDLIRDSQTRRQQNNMGVIWASRFKRGEGPTKLVYKTGFSDTTPKVPNKAPEFPLRSIKDRRKRGFNMRTDQILESMANGK